MSAPRVMPTAIAAAVRGAVMNLPPVKRFASMVLRDLIESGVAPVVRLTEVFRQAAGSRIVLGAHRILEGLLPEPSPPGAHGKGKVSKVREDE